MAQHYDAALAQPRFNMLLLALFGGLALLLAAIGVYGLLSYRVAQRTQEIGVRMALGAQLRDVVGMVVGEGLWLTGLGVGAGLVGAFALTRVLGSLLFGVSPVDVQTFVTVTMPSPPSRSSRATYPRAARQRSIRWSRCGQTKPCWGLGRKAPHLSNA